MFFSGNNDGGRMMLNQTFTIGIYMWNLPYEASLIRMHVIWKCPNGLKFSNQSKSGNIAAPRNGESNEIWRDENI
jgi:hypothetical protein